VTAAKVVIAAPTKFSILTSIGCTSFTSISSQITPLAKKISAF
jgi:hypothetical protein